MDLSPSSPKTHQNVKHPYFDVYSRKKYYKRLGCMGYQKKKKLPA
jgi:hypothetical protein